MYTYNICMNLKSVYVCIDFATPIRVVELIFHSLFLQLYFSIHFKEIKKDYVVIACLCMPFFLELYFLQILNQLLDV